MGALFLAAETALKTAPRSISGENFRNEPPMFRDLPITPRTRRLLGILRAFPDCCPGVVRVSIGGP